MRELSKLEMVFLTVAAVAPSAFGETAKEIASKVFPGVVIVLMEDRNGQPASLGSGFLVAQGVVASNFHVVEGGSRGLVKVVGDDTKYEIEGVVASDTTNDLVLLKIKNLKSVPLTVGDSDAVAVGDQVYAVGNPRGLEGTFSQGIVSSVRKLEGGSLIQITAPISPGSSGGPILDSTGKVIGVAVATYKGGQNLNFAIPANALRTLLSLKAEVRPMSVLKKASSEKSILKDLGPPSTAGVIARKLEWGVFDFKFSVLNQLRQPIKDVSCVVIFFDDEDVPFDFKTVMLKNEIPAGLASWTDPVSVDINTCRNVNTTYRNLRKSEQMPKEGRTEIRVLGFELAD